MILKTTTTTEQTSILLYNLCAAFHMSPTQVRAHVRACEHVHLTHTLHDGLLKMIHKGRVGKFESMPSCSQDEQAGGSQVKRDVMMILLNSLAVNP